MPAPHRSTFTGKMLFLTLNQQRQDTECSAISIHVSTIYQTRAQQFLRWATVWPQQTSAEKGGCCAPFLGELGPHLTQYGLGRGLLCNKWHLDPSSRLATIHQRHRQTGQVCDNLISSKMCKTVDTKKRL